MELLSNKTYLKKLLFILGIAILLRSLFCSIIIRHPERSIFGDSITYLELADNLTQYSSFSDTINGQSVPHAERTFLYPFFISSIFSIAGKKLEAIIALQNLMDIGSVLLVFLIGSTLTGTSVALCSAFLYAINPIPLIQNQYILTETLFVFLLLLGLFFMVHSYKNNSTLKMSLGILFWGLASHVRPAGIWLFIILGGAVGWLKWSKGWVRALYSSALAMGLFLLILAPWLIRNYIVFNKLFFSTNNQKAFVAAHVIPTLARANNVTPQKAFQDLFDQLLLKYPLVISETSYENISQDPKQTELFFKEGLSQLGRVPKIYFLNLIQNSVRIALIPGTGRSEYITTLLKTNEIPIRPLRKEINDLVSKGEWGKAIAHLWKARIGSLPWTGQILWWWIFLFEGTIFIFALGGLCAIFYHSPSFILKVFGSLSFLTTLYFIAAPGLEVEPRYRFASEPLLCILASFFLYSINLKDQKNRLY